MRLIKAMMALFFILSGVVFGALNKQLVHIDLWFRAIDVGLGFALLTVLLIGSLLGGLVVMVGMVWPLRRRWHKAGETGSGPDLQELANGSNR